jgi:hypothetical protein
VLGIAPLVGLVHHGGGPRQTFGKVGIDRVGMAQPMMFLTLIPSRLWKMLARCRACVRYRHLTCVGVGITIFL